MMLKLIKRLKFPNKADGFTLIEIIMTIVLLSFIFIAITPILTNGFSFINIAGDKSKKLHEAKKEVNDIIISGNDSTGDLLTLSAITFTPQTTTSASITTISGISVYRRTVEKDFQTKKGQKTIDLNYYFHKEEGG